MILPPPTENNYSQLGSQASSGFKNLLFKSIKLPLFFIVLVEPGRRGGGRWRLYSQHLVKMNHLVNYDFNQTSSHFRFIFSVS